jgi:hypothetical protein
VCFVEEEMLTEISQNGEIDPEKWKDARESLLRRLDLVLAIHFPLHSNILITIIESSKLISSYRTVKYFNFNSYINP